MKKIKLRSLALGFLLPVALTPVLFFVSCGVNELKTFTVDTTKNDATSYIAFWMDLNTNQGKAQADVLMWDVKESNQDKLASLPEFKGKINEVKLRIKASAKYENGFQKLLKDLVYLNSSHSDELFIPTLIIGSYTLAPKILNDSAIEGTIISSKDINKNIATVKTLSTDLQAASVTKTEDIMTVLNKYYVAVKEDTISSVEQAFADVNFFTGSALAKPEILDDTSKPSATAKYVLATPVSKNKPGTYTVKAASEVKMKKFVDDLPTYMQAKGVK